jgi:hypothetical protein
VERAGPLASEEEEEVGGSFAGVAKLGAGECDGPCPLRFTAKPRW